MDKKISPEDKKTVEENKLILDVTKHEGWGIIHNRFVDKILAVQNIFEVSGKTIEERMIDLESRKKLAEFLTDFLADIEGTKEQVNLYDEEKHGFIIRN